MFECLVCATLIITLALNFYTYKFYLSIPLPPSLLPPSLPPPSLPPPSLPPSLTHIFIVFQLIFEGRIMVRLSGNLM